jgi:hypothetical protein
VNVRKKYVDATYTESEVPSRHTPRYDIDDGVHLIPPNDLVHLEHPAAGYTIIGAGKTAMDTCCWLMDTGVAPDSIRWIKPRDAWQFNRKYFQPLDLVGAYMQLQGRWIESIAASPNPIDCSHRLEEAEVFVRIDPDLEATMFRGSTISDSEVDALRSIENVVRLGYVRRIGTRTLSLDGGDVPSTDGEVYVDCTAQGVRAPAAVPIFDGNRITVQLVTIGIIPWSAATLGFIEATRADAPDDEKNGLCPPVVFTGRIADLYRLAYAGMTGMVRRSAEPDIAAWTAQCRLDPSRGAVDHMADPDVADGMARMAGFGAAMARLQAVIQ